MNAALEILGFSEFLKALFPYGTHMYHCTSKDKKEKKVMASKVFILYQQQTLTSFWQMLLVDRLTKE